MLAQLGAASFAQRARVVLALGALTRNAWTLDDPSRCVSFSTEYALVSAADVLVGWSLLAPLMAWMTRERVAT